MIRTTPAIYPFIWATHSLTDHMMHTSDRPDGQYQRWHAHRWQTIWNISRIMETTQNMLSQVVQHIAHSTRWDTKSPIIWDTVWALHQTTHTSNNVVDRFTEHMKHLLLYEDHPRHTCTSLVTCITLSQMTYQTTHHLTDLMNHVLDHPVMQHHSGQIHVSYETLTAL